MKLAIGLAGWMLMGIWVCLGSAEAAAKEGLVSYASGDATLEGFLVTPKGKGPFPGMVVIHEWWGLNEQTKEDARRLAKEGYVALAVDLYRGRAATDRDEAHELMRGLPQDRAGRDLVAAFDYLASRSDVRADRIGSIGWCMGGGYSLMLALVHPRLAASVIYYGRLVTDKAMLDPIQAPILGLFGENDRGITPAMVREFEETMRELGKSITVHIYPDAGHAFANPTRDSYREAAARDAWEKTTAFLAQHLKRK